MNPVTITKCNPFNGRSVGYRVGNNKIPLEGHILPLELYKANGLVYSDLGLGVSAPKDGNNVAIGGFINLGLNRGARKHHEGLGLQGSGGEGKAQEQGRDWKDLFHGST